MPNPPYRDLTGQMYNVEVTMTGFAVKATGLTAYLSLGVLYLHTTLVILHVA